MKSVSVISAVYNEELNIIEMVKEIINDDDSVELNLHTFDPEALEWRSVIYGIDDEDELIDIIVYEPYVEDIKPLEYSIEVARARCRERIAEVKERSQPKPRPGNGNGNGNGVNAALPGKYAVSTKEQAYSLIKDSSLFHPVAIEAKREFVEAQRLSNTEPKARPNNEERARLLKERFDAMKGRDPVPEDNSKLKKVKIGELPAIVMEGRKKR